MLDAKTGAYKKHFKLVPKDWHDWDVSNPPVLIQTQGGKQLMVGRAQRRTPVWLRSRHQHHALSDPGDANRECRRAFLDRQICPFLPRHGSGGGTDGPAYDPQTNLNLIGEVEWCTTVTLQSDKDIRL